MDVLVSGSGPAGVATAIGLARCGVSAVILAGTPRPSWLEGLSLRTREALREAGCERAAAVADAAPVWRHVSWGGMHGEVNRELLVDRSALDAALRRDAEAAGVALVDDGLLRCDRADPSGWVAHTRRGQRLAARYWVDARGRSAPRGRQRVRGVATLAVALPCAVDAGPPIASALVAGPRGFFWVVARGPDAVVQWFCDPPKGPRPASLALELRAEIDELRTLPGPDWLVGLRPGRNAARPRCRDATPYRVDGVDAPIGRACLRVGDAAAASDPLSGQGVWSALAMARSATACVRTQLDRPNRADLVDRFYRGRVEAIDRRNTAKGSEFYREEARWPESVFWSRRRGSRGAPTPAEAARVETRPVVSDGFVEARPVVCTPEHPDGVWRLDGVPVAELLECANAPDELLARRFSVAAAQVKTAKAWLRAAAPGLGGPESGIGGRRASEKADATIDGTSPDPAQ